MSSAVREDRPLAAPSLDSRFEHVRLEELDLLGAVRECSPEWPAFRDRASLTPFLQPDYLEVWARMMGRMEACRVVVARDHGDLVGFGPFMIVDDPLGPIRVPTVRFIGNNVGYPGDVLFSDIATANGGRSTVSRAILERISRWRVIRWDLGYIALDSQTTAFATEVLGGPRNGAPLESKPYVRLPLPPTWDSYLERLSGAVRRNFRRKLRRLGEIGEVNVRIARDPDLVRRTVRELVLNHHRWWDGTNRGGWFGDDRVERYLEEAAVLLARQGTFLGFALEVDGEAIAWNAGAFDGTRYFEQIISYDRARTDYSPGMLLENLVVKALIDLHAQGIELGPGFTELKHEIGGLPTEYGHLHGYRGWFRAIDAIHQTWVHKPVTP